MTTDLISKGYLISQDSPEIIEHSIVVQRYDGCISIIQNGSDVIVADLHIKELIRALRECAKGTP